MRQLFPVVVSNDRVALNLYLLWAQHLYITDNAIAGQYLMVRCGEPPFPLLRRPLSIHRINGEKFALLYSIAGRGTEQLSKIRPGDKLDIIGPLGNGFSHDVSPNPLLIAGGRGIAPLTLLAETFFKQGYKVKLLYGVKTQDELYFPDRLPAGIKMITVTEDGSHGNKGLVTDLLKEYIADAAGIFACGPFEMYRTIFFQLRNTTYSKTVQVSLETILGCGIGICYGCTIPTVNGYKQVCKNGPVFNLSELIIE